jgi:hypothetical protein
LFAFLFCLLFFTRLSFAFEKQKKGKEKGKKRKKKVNNTFNGRNQGGKSQESRGKKRE